MNRLAIHAIALCAALACTTFSIAAPDEDEEGGELDNFTTYYYLEKDTSKLPGFLKSMQDSKMLDKHESAMNPTAAWLSVVFSSNREKIPQLARRTKFTGKAKKAVEIALWRSGHADEIEKIFGKMPEFATASRVSLKKQPLKGPGDLDAMWGAFLASGNTTYVNKIIDVLDEDHELSGDDTIDDLTRKAAEWSLQSNMMQHELVYRLIRKESQTRTGKVKKQLDKMLTSIKDVKLEKSDGAFTAALVTMDQEAMKEFQKPSDEGVHIRSKSKAKRGDIIGVKIVFANLELTDDLHANVVYDLKVLDPDGNFYDKTDLKNLEGLTKKIPTRFQMFDNAQVVMIRFEPKDKLGKYQFIAKVRDKVGDKEVSLKKTVELTE